MLTENCHYLGRVGRVQIGAVQVVGLSGIFHPETFYQSRPSVDDMGSQSNKDYTDYNEDDIEQAMSYGRCDIVLLHNWPKGIINDQEAYRLNSKRRPSQPDEIGNEYTQMLVEELQPSVVACGHRHVRYRNTLAMGAKNLEVCCVANVEAGRDAVMWVDEALNVIG